MIIYSIYSLRGGSNSKVEKDFIISVFDIKSARNVCQNIINIDNVNETYIVDKRMNRSNFYSFIVTNTNNYNDSTLKEGEFGGFLIHQTYVFSEENLPKFS